MSLADEPRPLQRGYYRRVEIAFVIAAAFHAAVFAIAPPYVPRPYRLREPPLKLVSAAVVGVGDAEAPGPSAPAGSTPAPATSAPVTEQLQLSLSVPPSPSNPETGRPERHGPAGSGVGGGPSGTGTGGGLAGGGQGEVEPPVFYAFDTPPKATRRVVPEYPASAKAQGAQGTVIVNANIDEQGRIMRAWVVQSTAPEVLIQAAIDAIYQFEFSPGSERGHPVKCTVAVPFDFHLNMSM